MLSHQPPALTTVVLLSYPNGGRLNYSMTGDDSRSLSWWMGSGVGRPQTAAPSARSLSTTSVTNSAAPRRGPTGHDRNSSGKRLGLIERSQASTMPYPKSPSEHGRSRNVGPKGR